MPSPSSMKSSRPKRLAEAGLLVTPRDIALLCSVHTYRQLTREQIERLHFSSLARRSGGWQSHVAIRRLGLLTAHEYLHARPLPHAKPFGRPPLLYSLGPNAVHLVADALELEPAAVLRRQRQDARLEWSTYPHRAAITELRVVLSLAAQAAGHRLTWHADEELAQLGERAVVDGHPVPVRPDAFFVLSVVRLDGRTRHYPCFLELQLRSKPAVYRRKCRAFLAYFSSGRFTARFGFHSFRLLGVADSRERARHLQAAAEAEAPNSRVFWSASLSELVAAPWAAVWFVAGCGDGQQRLLGEDDEQRSLNQAVTVWEAAGAAPAAPAITAAPREQPF